MKSVEYCPSELREQSPEGVSDRCELAEVMLGSDAPEFAALAAAVGAARAAFSSRSREPVDHLFARMRELQDAPPADRYALLFEGAKALERFRAEHRTLAPAEQVELERFRTTLAGDFAADAASAERHGQFATAAYYARAAMLASGRAPNETRELQTYLAAEHDPMEGPLVRFVARISSILPVWKGPSELSGPIKKIEARTSNSLRELGLMMDRATEEAAQANGLSTELQVVSIADDLGPGTQTTVRTETSTYKALTGSSNPAWNAWNGRMTALDADAGSARLEYETWKGFGTPGATTSTTTYQDSQLVGEGRGRHAQTVLVTETRTNTDLRDMFAGEEGARRAKLEKAVVAYNAELGRQPPRENMRETTKTWTYPVLGQKWGALRGVVRATGAFPFEFEKVEAPKTTEFVLADPVHGVESRSRLLSPTRRARMASMRGQVSPESSSRSATGVRGERDASGPAGARGACA